VYDEVLYPGDALAQAHPDRLATLATLFGISAPSVETARVLELGCGDGLNLISIAHGLPNATCVGLDLASAGIKKGEKTIGRLGLKNVKLLQADIWRRFHRAQRNRPLKDLMNRRRLINLSRADCRRCAAWRYSARE
jgi:tRNA G46 methylase TrmB